MEKNLQELIMEHEPHVSLDTANLLKQAGFDWNCQGFYKENVFYSGSIEYCSNYHYQESVVKAPSLYVAQRWLREVKGIHITVKPDEASINCKYFVTVIISETKWGNVQDENKKTTLFNTYEEAQEAGIKKALEIILEKKYDTKIDF